MRIVRSLAILYVERAVLPTLCGGLAYVGVGVMLETIWMVIKKNSLSCVFPVRWII